MNINHREDSWRCEQGNPTFNLGITSIIEQQLLIFELVKYYWNDIALFSSCHASVNYAVLDSYICPFLKLSIDTSG